MMKNRYFPLLSSGCLWFAVAMALPLCAQETVAPAPSPGTTAENSQSSTASTDKAGPEQRGQQKSDEPTPEELKAKEELKNGDFTEAERIARIQTLLERERSRQADTQRLLDELEADYEKAAEAFQVIDEKYTAERGRLKTVTGDKRKKELEAELDRLQGEWTTARNEFNTIINRRRAAQQQLETIEDKIKLGEEMLDFLVTGTVTEEEKPQQVGQEKELNGAAAAASDPAAAAKSNPAVPTQLIPGVGNGKRETAAAEKVGADGGSESVVVNERLAAARRELKLREADEAAAQRELELLDKGLELFERDRANAEKLLASARQAADTAAGEVEQAETQLQNPAITPDADAVANFQRVRDENLALLNESREEIRRQSTRLTEVTTLLEQLRVNREEVAQRATEARAAVEAAESRLWFYESPLAPHRLMDWTVRNGPKVIGILLLMLATWWVTKLIGAKIISGLIHRSRRGTLQSREMRAETMRRVFQSTADVAVFIVGALAVLEIAGMDVTVLLGGAAVLGAALAFGSQNLIRDYFSGFMMLLENQYSVGDTIRIAGIAGLVEDISLRVTVLRDEEGIVHFIPHSQVTSVSNMTHGWSRAVFNISVGRQENVERVIQTLIELARELRKDAVFSQRIIDEPEMLGVDSLSESAMIVKMLLKTRPTQQWSVRRELLRRIHQKFTEMGIEMPLPHQVIHLQRSGDEGKSDAAEGNGVGRTRSR